MGIFGRLANAWRAGISAFNGKALIPSQEIGTWDLFASRQFRYAHADAYVNNTIYTALSSYSTQHKFQGGLYKHTRGIYNPTKRLVELYVSKVYGGMLDIKDMSSGAIPISADDRLLKEAIAQLWKWSNWGTQKSLFVRYGATYGDAPIWIVDDRAAGKVRLEVMHPSRIKEAEFDEVGNVKSVVIEYVKNDERLTSPTGIMRKNEDYVYTLVANADEFSTYKDGEPFAYYADANGNLVSSWANEYGFVPMVIAKHADLGMAWGANAVAGSLRKIDEVNDAASLLNDQVRNTVRAVWYYAGVAKTDGLDVSAANRDELPAVYGPADSQPYPMVAPIAIESALANIQSMLAELERDMPELSMHRLREQGGLTAPGVRTAYGDAIDRIIEARGNYDDALVRAQMMAISIGGFNRYEDFESFTLDSYAAGDLQHYIGERPVIQDSLSLETKLDKLVSSGAPNTAIWSEMGYSDDVIKRWELENEAKKPLMIDQPQTPQLTDGSQVDADGNPVAPTQNAPAVRGSKLPSEKARQVDPITADEIAKIAAARRTGGTS